MLQLIGWSASVVLLCTILTQIYRQWQQRMSKGVLPGLFIGEVVASTGFVIYSRMVRDAVFIVTDLLLLVSAVFGLGIRHIAAASSHRSQGRALIGGLPGLE
jgi:MtN3 and saliva related transmembrane protein